MTAALVTTHHEHRFALASPDPDRTPLVLAGFAFGFVMIVVVWWRTRRR